MNKSVTKCFFDMAEGNSNRVLSVPPRYRWEIIDAKKTLIADFPAYRDLFNGGYNLPLAHATFCPLKESESVTPLIVKPAVTALVTNASQTKFVLTKRSNKLRLFPNMWVFPGGKIDDGENWREGVLREMQEEIGLTSDMIGKITPIGFWESIFPIHRRLGEPQACNVVLYVKLQLQSDWKPTLQATEVSGMSWMELDHLQELLSQDANRSEIQMEKFCGGKISVPLDEFECKLTEHHGITEGTLFALVEAFSLQKELS
ncbi:NUDIX domain-containing protein [Candidatus Uabimicrobium amorphum]|uniref:7,8-dihydro-8-oxoguanine-triphosphatase n=1 Tax=Uabimicrobium amorphum TaxID=2596890 RepID=A0A5S9IP71_UABAM|nr:NUDIX domain-containing protein [Candidatus Uabimicrobium amorphum]BBM85528.1 7,8-dihydro-8-oxoguanine-triphosphatase [Candidatus Uabimicrobium amorphum]